MEALIIAVVLGIITSLFNKGKKEDNKKPTKQMPPFSSQPAPRQKQEVRPARSQNRPKTLEDFASEVFGQLNEKSKPEVKTIETPAPIKVDLPKREVSRESFGNKPMLERTPSTRQLTERPIVQMIKQQEEQSLHVVPATQRELMQAIVMSEILGPPKSKR